jgi:uncharacterized protein
MTKRCGASNEVRPNGQRRYGRWGTRRFLEAVKANPQLADDVIAAVAQLGPSTAGQIEAQFASGVLTTATRVGFARHYDLVERVLPASVLAREVDDEAVRELTPRAAGKRAG